jgi:predicted RNA polymerase sigma factor
LLGELYAGTDDSQARLHFQQAAGLARTAADKQALQRKMDSLPPLS